MATLKKNHLHQKRCLLFPYAGRNPVATIRAKGVASLAFSPFEIKHDEQFEI
ncbi:hypothetical protein HDF15_001735 [Granulicella mallensis]|uniref:Uncharacterized protein n=1 Tax=Granulicella mallensis TaxID=940614 RepID=A0A7W8E8H0_9BACT|nr:hypothetical protein [Granulicella mallensis]